MIHKFDHRGGGAEFSCDEAGCGETFEAKVSNIKTAWDEAMQFGWRILVDHDPISSTRHYCPSHAKVRMIA